MLKKNQKYLHQLDYTQVVPVIQKQGRMSAYHEKAVNKSPGLLSRTSPATGTTFESSGTVALGRNRTSALFEVHDRRISAMKVERT